MGRSLLLLVSGFIIIFGIIQNALQNRQQILTERAPEYYYQEQSRNIAGAMLEIALGNSNNGNNYKRNEILNHIRPTTIQMLGGTGKIKNVTSSNFNTRLEVEISGEIERPDGSKSITEINATFNRNPFSIYAYFTDNESDGIAFGSDDVLNGPVHTNGTFLFRGDPTFNGPISSPNTWEDDTPNNNSDPVFNGGSDFNTKPEELPTEAEEINELVSNDFKFDEEIFLEFHGEDNGGSNNNGDAENDDDDDGDDDDGTSPSAINNNNGTVEISTVQRVCTIQLFGRCFRHEYQKQSLGTFKLSDFNGVISSTENVHVKGTVDGQVTIHSKKDVRIAGDIVYENRNYKDKSKTISDDRLGIVSENETIVNRDAHQDQGVSDLFIDASILTMGDSFQVEDYGLNFGNEIFGFRGTLHLLGGLIQRERGPVGIGNQNGVAAGFAKNYNYDERFRKNSTPGFPRKKNFDIENWRETTRIEKPSSE